MNQLAITVRGEVLSSNFDEWKLELIAEIQAVNTELTTEAQFAHAQTDVKRFKVAEQALKKAKESAIDQASDIQRLFAAIDEVSEAVRQVRLSLERQIRRRKLEIKEEFIQLGIANIQSYINQQDANFQIIDHSDYLHPGAFEAVMKRRASITTLSTAIDKLCVQITGQIDERAALVKDNATRLDSLPIAHQTLFQDRSTLLALSPGQLDEIIDQRIEVLERQVEITSDKPDFKPAVCDAGDQGSGAERDSRGEDEIRETQIKEAFVLTVELMATRAGADAFLREVESTYARHPLVRRFRLERI
jgi:hypothetical protein